MRPDKRKHLIVGIILGFFGSYLALILRLNCISLWGVSLAFIAGLSKEVIYDLWMGKGKPEFMDFLYTFIGGIIGVILINLFLPV